MTLVIRLIIAAFLTAGLGILGKVNAQETTQRPLLSIQDLLRVNPGLLDDIVNESNSAPRVYKRADYPESWTVAEFDGKKFSNKVIERFIQSSKLTDSKMIELFKEANKDYAKYLELKADWVYSWFQPSIKQFIYYKMLEKEALRDGQQRKAFTATQSEYYDATDKAERDVLKKLLDEGKGIRYAREKFAEFLRKSDYPHKADESLEDTYFRWLKLQNARIKETIRIAQVNKMEFLKAHPKANANYFQPITAIYDLNQKARRDLTEIFQTQDLNDQKLAELLGGNILATTVLKRWESISLQDKPINLYAEKAPQKFEAALRIIEQNKDEFLGQKVVSQVLHYENLAGRFAQKYDSVEKLEELEKESLDKFLRSNDGDYRNLVLAKLYALAVTIKKHSPSRELIREQVEQQIKDAQSLLSSAINPISEMKNLEHSNLLFPEFIASQARSILGLNQKSADSDYRAQVLSFGIWVMKFRAKAVARQDSPSYIFEFREYEKFEAQDHLEAYWLNDAFEKNLIKYQDRTLKRRNRYSVRLNPFGQYTFSTRESIDKIFE